MVFKSHYHSFLKLYRKNLAYWYFYVFFFAMHKNTFTNFQSIFVILLILLTYLLQSLFKFYILREKHKIVRFCLVKKAILRKSPHFLFRIKKYH